MQKLVLTILIRLFWVIEVSLLVTSLILFEGPGGFMHNIGEIEAWIPLFVGIGVHFVFTGPMNTAYRELYLVADEE